MNRQQEIREAISAADFALERLEVARDCLKSAGNWGMLDIFSDGFLGMISTMMKHGKMDRAQQEMEAARTAMQRFARELRDVDAMLNLHLPVNDFLGFADYFFDGLIADWMMQRRINDAKRQIEEATRQVRWIRNQLQGLLA